MIEKNTYHKLKKFLKTWSKPQIKNLCNDMEMNDDEIKLFTAWYDGDSVIKITMDNFESNRAYTNHIKNIFTKIYNYFKFMDISF